jgi:5'-deoxynucleotidase YfbR-like HD superfamily hydrolase
MITFTGRRFYPSDPRAEDVSLEDIAHGLSRICRFGGQSAHHYSVAQHSVLVSEGIESVGHSTLEAMCGLLHDAAEAYIGDVVWPLKRAPEMAGYADIEARVERAIADRFGLPYVFPPIVKRFDLVALATEKRDIMGHASGATIERQAADSKLGEWHCGVIAPFPAKIHPLEAMDAKYLFLRRWERLSVRLGTRAAS